MSFFVPAFYLPFPNRAPPPQHSAPSARRHAREIPRQFRPVQICMLYFYHRFQR